MMLNRIGSRAEDSDLSRRDFLAASAAAGGGLLLSLCLPFGRGVAATSDSFSPNAFIRIEADGEVVLTMPYVEMGQGTYTSIPMLIAEELEVSLKQVRLEHAPANQKLYANPLLGVQATGNSNAMRRLEANARSRRDCADDADLGRFEAVGYRCKNVPRTGWRSDPHRGVWRACQSA